MTDESKINILVVDDKPDKLLALEAVLSDLGQNVVRASSGREGLRCLLNADFAVILLDVNMPSMDGFETAALIRQRASTRDVPIIFITAMDDETHISRGYSLGAVDYIQTPVLPDVLKTKVSVFVDLYRKTEQIRRQATWLRQRATQLHQLTAASITINSALSTDQMLRVVVDTAREILGSTLACSRLIADHDVSQVTVVRSDCATPNDSEVSVHVHNQPALHALVCKMNRPLRMNQMELENHPAWQQPTDPAAQSAAHNWLAVPLTGRDGRNLGLIEVWDKCVGDFSGDDEAILVQLSQMASIALENTLYAAERETNRIKDEFLSTLSHELRTPLNAILGWTQLLRMENVDAEVSHGLEVIDRNARAQTKLIEDLLDVSRITTGKLRLSRRPSLLAPLVLAATESLRPMLAAKNIHIDCELSATDIAINVDPDRLQQVCWNLLSNAAKFTPEAGRITIRLDHVGQSVRLQVADTGRGIEPSFLPHVFDRFRQADSTSTRSHGGLGIGLMIVRHIVQLHGGSVQAESAGPGTGATFTVTLPAPVSKEKNHTPQPHTQMPPVSSMDANINLSGLQVLIVDDEADARDFMAETLRRASAVVIQADSVASALEQFARARPDVLVTDIAMPEQDGYHLIRALRQLSPEQGGEIPAVALTAYARQEDKMRALAAGFQLHLAKPVEPRHLVYAVSHLAKSTRPVSA